MAGRHAGAEPGSLQGRGSECALLDDVIAAIRAGESRALVIHGEAGIGKTALLHHVVESAADFRLLQATGVESEMELAFASLHQLCAPMLEALGTLPRPQRDALAIAFGLSEGPAPDRFLVGLAVLTLFSEAAHERPLLCVVDDAHWLDEVSARTLAFVARRLLAEPVGLVFAARTLEGDFRGLPELEIFGLGADDARELLRSAVVFRLDERVRDRIVAETRGNPLALLELPRGLTVAQLAGGFGLSEATRQALPNRLEQSFERRIAAVPAQARLLLLAAAAEPIGDPLLLWRAAEQLGIEPTAADATDGLLTIEESVRFRHPLVRSAAYRSAPAEQRRAVHLALAEATDREADPDRRAWHLAAATARPDDEVALALEQSAGRAQARGGVAATAAFLQRAAALTENPKSRAERALAAAQASLGSGAFDAAGGLLAMAEAGAMDDFQRARIELLRAQLAFLSGPSVEAPQLLLSAARGLEPFDLDLARETYLSAWGAATVAGRFAQEGVLLEICRAIRSLPARSGAPVPLDLLLEALALISTDGWAAAVPALQRAATAVTHLAADEHLRWGWVAPSASTLSWDEEAEHAIVMQQVQIFRYAGALANLPLHLNAVGQGAAWRGDFAGALSAIAEAASVAAATGSRFSRNAAVRLAALQGREAEATPIVAHAIEEAAAARQGQGEIHAQWAASVLYNGLARYKDAAAAAHAVTSQSLEPFASRWAQAELVEAAARLGEIDLAQKALAGLAETTRPAGNDFALGVEARSRALLAEGDAAEGLYLEAIERLGRTRLRPELARAHLVYGEWLRREGRRVAAREQLRAAHELFTAIGMEGFAERTRRELLATGETVRKRSAETREDLTPQEEQIARLARDGLSNPEIGAQLFLSSRTVEWHLRKVYSKLHISSRRELRAALPEPGRTLVSA
jgi:DNA-binding CsgD family transcriptional regulator